MRPPLVPWLNPGPVSRHPGWLEYVQTPQTEAELAALRGSVARNTPYGSASWVERAVETLGLQSSVRPPGRPRKQSENALDCDRGGLFCEKEP
jgi:putative transposase